MLQDDAPPGVGLGAAPVTLVHDNNVKEVAREIAIGTRARLIIGHGLVGSKKDIAARCCLPPDTITGVTKLRKFIILGLA